MALRAAAAKHLASGNFRHAGVDLTQEWRSVDPLNPETRRTLLAYVGTHIRLASDQEAELAAAGLALIKNRLVELEQPKKPAAKPTQNVAKT